MRRSVRLKLCHQPRRPFMVHPLGDRVPWGMGAEGAPAAALVAYVSTRRSPRSSIFWAPVDRWGGVSPTPPTDRALIGAGLGSIAGFRRIDPGRVGRAAGDEPPPYLLATVLPAQCPF